MDNTGTVLVMGSCEHIRLYEIVDSFNTPIIIVTDSDFHNHGTTCGCEYCSRNTLSNIIQDRAPLNYLKFIDEQKERDKFDKKIYDFESQQITIKQGLNLKSNYKNPKKVNRKLSQYSCSMRGRNKPCRRVAVVNQD
jgi:hypothetical protein